MKKRFLAFLMILIMIVLFVAATPTFFKGALKAGSTSKYCTIDENGIAATGSGVDISGFTDLTISGDFNSDTLNGAIAVIGSDTDYLTIDNSGIAGSGTVNVSGITNITNSGTISGTTAIIGSDTDYLTIDNSGIAGSGTVNISGITNITNSGYISTKYIKGESGQICGTASIDSGAGSVTVTYDSVFDTVPIIVATALDTYSISISNSTETSCNLVLTTGTVATTTTLNWIAIEPR